VTDGHDRKTLLSILSVLYTPNILDDDYKFSASGIYYAPSDCQYADYIEFIKELPTIAKPEAFGLHENADITKDQKEADELLSAVEATQVHFFFLFHNVPLHVPLPMVP
jgi:dynein heavy chain